MKNSSVISAIIGGTFFAVPYLALSAPILPSLAIGACAFGAGELMFHATESKRLKDINRSLYNDLQEAKNKNNQILIMSKKVEDQELRNNIIEINKTVSKIITSIENEPKKAKNMSNFFDYYLPVTLNILKRYDDIENQSLNSLDGKEFMEKTRKMIEKVNGAFKTQLSNMYQSEIVDTNAELKVFDSMLRADGFDTEIDFKKMKGDK